MGFVYSAPTFIPGFVKQVSMIRDVDKLNDVATRLQDELLKIQVFHRELPLSMSLLNDAIQVLKQETSQYTTKNAHQPVLEEFIPLNKVYGDDNMEINKADHDGEKKDCGTDKKNWMSSVQLWSAHGNETTDNQIPTNTLKTKGDAKGSVDKEDARIAELSLVSKQDSFPRVLNSKIGGIKVLNSSSHSNGRKQRRCWSAEMHRKFVDALTQLGGAQVATPKQIKELMQVDGLTNDEVKSHLQKYRLHARRVLDKSGLPTKDECGESSKTSSSQSRSPDGPFLFDENEDDEKSESYCWKGYVDRPETDHS